jgi:hypothetical protein
LKLLRYVACSLAALLSFSSARAGHDFELSESDYMRVSSFTSMIASNTYPVSMACWFKAETISTLQTLMAITQVGVANSTDSNMELQINASNAIVARYESAAASVGTVSSGTWTLAVAVHASSASHYAYLNTTKSTHNTTARDGNWDSLTLGANGYASQGNFFDGVLGECAVYNFALSDANVSTLYNGGDGADMDTVGAPVWYRKLRTDLTTPATGTSPTNNGATQVGDDPWAEGGGGSAVPAMLHLQRLMN